MEKTTGVRQHDLFKRKELCIAISALLCPSVVLAAPVGGTVASGTATIRADGNLTTVQQDSQKAVINWQGFSIAGGETVKFEQTSTSAITLNRVVGNERSVIDGAMSAKGKVYLVNANGVVFGRGSHVDTSGLVASALDISDQDFNNGNYRFSAGTTGATGGAVSNAGEMNTTAGG